MFPQKEGLVAAFVSMAVISVVLVSVMVFVIGYIKIIGIVILLCGFMPIIPLKLAGRSIKSVGADIIFGAVDTGFLGIAALIGANFAGILGAIVGGVVGDSITDGFAGLFEGRAAEYLRRHGIEEARTPLSSSMGKMSGCLFGVGTVLAIAWGLLWLIP